MCAPQPGPDHMAAFQPDYPEPEFALDGEVRSILARRLHREESSIAWESSIASISDDESLPELWLALEDAFDIELDEGDVERVRTARDVVDVVRVRISERNGRR